MGIICPWWFFMSNRFSKLFLIGFIGNLLSKSLLQFLGDSRTKRFDDSAARWESYHYFIYPSLQRSYKTIDHSQYRSFSRNWGSKVLGGSNPLAHCTEEPSSLSKAENHNGSLNYLAQDWILMQEMMGQYCTPDSTSCNQVPRNCQHHLNEYVVYFHSAFQTKQRKSFA